MKRPQAKFPRRQRGVAAIEATIALPVLFLMFYAVGEFGRLLYQYNQLSSLSRNAVRYLSEQAKPGSTGLISISNSVMANTRNMAVTGTWNGGVPLLAGLQVANVSVTSANNEEVTVSITYNWTPMFGESIPGFFGDGISLDWNITASSTMRPII